MEGFITKAVSGTFEVFSDNKTYSCKTKGIIRNQKLTPIVGDNVIFSYDSINDFALIEKILPRKNLLLRPEVSNMDIALIVMSTIKPSFDFYLVDKLLVVCRCENIEPIIVVSKCEFMDDNLKELLDNYKLAGYQVIETSSKEKINIEKLMEKLSNKKVILCGQSAVGKSSLINAMVNDNKQSIGSYSEKLGRGKHETREIEFFKINDFFIADSPGFSSLEFKMEQKDFARVFKDFEVNANKCKYSTCLHNNEPGCYIKKLVEDNVIAKKRYENYLHMLKEIKDGKFVWKKK